MNTDNNTPEPIRELVTVNFEAFILFVRMVTQALVDKPLDWNFIGQTGTFNRVFRRWHQTAAGEKQYCEFFNGTTPRQVLEQSLNLRGLLNGRQVLISTRMAADVGNKDVGFSFYTLVYQPDINKEGETPLPLFTEFRAIEALLEKGIAVNKDWTLSNGDEQSWGYCYVSDIDFIPWFIRVIRQMNLLEFIPAAGNPETGTLFLNGQGKAYMSLSHRDQFKPLFAAFLETAAREIVAGIMERLQDVQPTVVEKTVVDNIKNDLLGILTAITASSGWLYVDLIFRQMWKALYKHFSDKLLSPKEFKAFISSDELWNKNYPEKSLITKHLYHAMGVGFDKHFLFPLDRYFGLAECVWTNLTQNADMFSCYFKFAQKLAGNYGNYSEQEKLEYAFLRDVFSSPCACLRMLAKAA
jgi:hypothetical protein